MSLLRGAFRLVRGLVLAGLVVAVAAAIAAFAFWRAVEQDFREAEVSVPVLIGLTVDEAASRLGASDLVLRVDARRPNEEQEAGRIFYQEPAAGASTRRQRDVIVVVSEGATRAPVPDLVGQSPRHALLDLGAGPLGLGRSFRVHSPRVLAGRVIAQSPEAGSGGEPADRIDVLVSLGPKERTFVMPDLRGRPLSLVETALGAAGVRITDVRQEAIPGVAGGLVHSQYPLPGARLSSGMPVTVVVSRVVEAPVGPVTPAPRLEVH